MLKKLRAWIKKITLYRLFKKAKFFEPTTTFVMNQKTFDFLKSAVGNKMDKYKVCVVDGLIPDSEIWSVLKEDNHFDAGCAYGPLLPAGFPYGEFPESKVKVKEY